MPYRSLYCKYDSLEPPFVCVCCGASRSIPYAAMCKEGCTSELPRVPEKPSGPGIARQAGNFAKAAAKHVAGGRRIASDAQVDERYQICLNCPSGLFEAKRTVKVQGGTDVVVGKCNDTSCGCDLKPAGVRGRNKLKWQSEACPRKHWLAILPTEKVTK